VRGYIYQVYGSEKFHKMGYLSICSLLKQGVSPEAISVFTDAPELFDFGCHIIPADKKTIRQWAGPSTFHHRVKIELIKHVADTVDCVDLIYLDSDTFIRSPLPEINDDKTVIFWEHESTHPWIKNTPTRSKLKLQCGTRE
jgi:hypothetical protein